MTTRNTAIAKSGISVGCRDRSFGNWSSRSAGIFVSPPRPRSGKRCAQPLRVRPARGYASCKGEPMTREDVSVIQPWKVLRQQLVLSAVPWLRVYREQVQLPSERIIDDFYRVVLPDFAVVVPVTTNGQIVMVRGYKH